MRYVIEQELRLEFPEPVYEHQCELRLLPTSSPAQRVQAATLTTEPNTKPATYTDCFGNQVHHFDVADAHEVLTARTHVTVETLLSNPFDYQPIAPERERAWIAEALRAQPRLWDFVLHRSPLTPHVSILADFELPAVLPDRPLLERVIAVRDWIAEAFTYCPEADSASDLAVVLETRKGNADDFAQLLITILRGWEIPARFVRGYQDGGEADDDADEEEHSVRHAWAEVLVPGAGWRGIDAAARLITGDSYVGVAVGRAASDAMMLRCAFKGEGQAAPAAIAIRLQRQQ